MSAAPGTYILVLRSHIRTTIEVGRLGRLEVVPGCYLYIGSAFGPGGVKARIGHHRRLSPKPYWHVDYLRRVVGLADAWCVYGKRCEHDWAAAVGGIEGAIIPLKGFGSSDCRCDSHLFHLPAQPLKWRMQQQLGVMLSPLQDGWNKTPREAGR